MFPFEGLTLIYLSVPIFYFLCLGGWSSPGKPAFCLCNRETCSLSLSQSPAEYFESLCGETRGSCTWIDIKITGKTKKTENKKNKNNALKNFWGPMPYFFQYGRSGTWKLSSVGDTDKQHHLETTIWKSQIVIFSYLPCTWWVRSSCGLVGVVSLLLCLSYCTVSSLK